MNRAQQVEQSERLAERLWREVAGSTMKEFTLLTGEMVPTGDWESFREAVFSKLQGKINKYLPDPLGNGQAAEFVPSLEPTRHRRRGRD